MNITHVHLWLTHAPILGSIFLTVLFLVALVYRHGFTQKVSLWFLGGIALVTIPTFFSGEAADDEATHHRLFTSALHALPGQGQIPAPPPLHSATIHRSTAVCSGQTETNLTTAEHSEALAWGEYTLFAQKAAKTRLAQLFNGIAAVELQDHFANSAILSGLVGSNAANMQTSRTAEADAVQMYTTFASAATSAGEPLVAKAFRQFSGDEAKHEAAFKRALTNVTS